jgi:hypothetical protein
MSGKRCRRVASAALRDRFERVSAEEREITTVAEVLRPFLEELGLESRDFARSIDATPNSGTRIVVDLPVLPSPSSFGDSAAGETPIS